MVGRMPATARTPIVVTRALAVDGRGGGGGALGFGARGGDAGSGGGALLGMTLDVARHELVALIGPADAGASTLLRVLAGAAAPRAGTARVFGLDPRALRGGAAVSVVSLPPACFLDGAELPGGASAAVLLADGLVRGLDSASAVLAVERLRERARGGCAVLLSTSDVHVAALCDRAVVMLRGRVVGDVAAPTAAAIVDVLAAAALAPAR